MATRLPFHFMVLFTFFHHLAAATPFTIFNFTNFTPNTPNLTFYGDAFTSGDNILQLTRNQVDGDLEKSVGRAVYARPVNLYDPSTRIIQNFVTHFEFIIQGVDPVYFGDGLAFFMAPVGAVLPENSTGEWLGLFNKTTNNSTSNQIVAVEFDTFQNGWDPDSNHVGIDINSIVSVTNMTLETDIKAGQIGAAWIGYNSTQQSFFAYVSYDQQVYNGIPSLSYDIDLTTVLPEAVIMGFSAATGSSTELHKILSWDLVSSVRTSQV